MSIIGCLLTNKLLVFFIVATCAFAISTIALGVQNTNYSEDLDECRNNQCPELECPTTPTVETTTEPTTDESTAPSPEEDMTDYLLPTSVVPKSYDLYLYPDLDAKNFTGKISIVVTVSEATNTIKLHGNGLKIETITIDENEVTYDLDSDHELIIISAAVPIGEKEIIIEYSGTMTGIVGLYHSTYSTYTEDDGNLRNIATTKFEPTYARQAFPCFDEPNMKAHFTVHILKPKDDDRYIALSNMPVMDEEITNEGILVHFNESVKMSTYLACFIVCDFNYTEEYILGRIPFRVYATPAQIEKTEYAKDVGKKVIEFYIDYFGIEYPLPKLDMIAIPDFVSGAMEHWGLVTYRETALLYSEEISSSANKQRVVTVVAHELAHSWFGNLVTMNWWNDLWLNEGFASYIEYKGANAAEPEWNMMDQFLIEDLHPVFILDATLGSHPIVQTVTTPDEITAIFDTISYNKGASVLRMLENVVGEETFKNGVTAYLNAHAYGNAATQDLLDELQTIIGDKFDVNEFMATWTVQMGYPILEVKSDGDEYVLTQKRFLTDPSNQGTIEASRYDYKWNIPVKYITDVDPEPKLVWFQHTDLEVRIAKPTSARWVKFNPKQVGYYRVNYEENHWKTLTDNVGEMAVADRVHLLEETFRIAESGHISYQISLNLMKYLVNEYDYLAWSVASTLLRDLKMYLSNSEYLTQLKNYVIELVTPAYENLTWDESTDDDHLKRRARVEVLILACSMGFPDCLAEANEHFEQFLKGSTVSQDLRTAVYNYGMASSSDDKWDLLWEKFVAETDAGEKLRLLSGLTYAKDTALLTRLLKLAEDETYIRSQDYFTCLQYIAANPIGTPIVWDYVRENWPNLVNRFGLNDRYLGSMITSITQTFTTQVKLDEMNAFFAKYPEAGAGSASRVRALEAVSNNIKWLEINKDDVETWIRQNAYLYRAS